MYMKLKFTFIWFYCISVVNCDNVICWFVLFFQFCDNVTFFFLWFILWQLFIWAFVGWESTGTPNWSVLPIVEFHFGFSSYCCLVWLFKSIQSWLEIGEVKCLIFKYQFVTIVDSVFFVIFHLCWMENLKFSKSFHYCIFVVVCWVFDSNCDSEFDSKKNYFCCWCCFKFQPFSFSSGFGVYRSDFLVNCNYSMSSFSKLEEIEGFIRLIFVLCIILLDMLSFNINFYAIFRLKNNWIRSERLASCTSNKSRVEKTSIVWIFFSFSYDFSSSSVVLLWKISACQRMEWRILKVPKIFCWLKNPSRSCSRKFHLISVVELLKIFHVSKILILEEFRLFQKIFISEAFSMRLVDKTKAQNLSVSLLLQLYGKIETEDVETKHQKLQTGIFHPESYRLHLLLFVVLKPLLDKPSESVYACLVFKNW